MIIPLVEYVCPKCGHFNPSARSQRKGFQSQQQSPAMQTPARPQKQGASPRSALRPPNTVDESPETEDSLTASDS